MFTCDDGSCILDSDVCNQVKDCSDGSDEMNCPDKEDNGTIL